jgi:NTP pyrophosphatase (non-canonical NTP hydrolase)
MRDLRELQKKIIEFRDVRDWKQFHNPKDIAISLVLEASELLEHFQWKDKPEVERHISKNIDEVSDELADVFYWVLLLAYDLKIDLPAALNKKMKKNAAKYPVKKAKGNHKKYTDLEK